MDTILFSLIGSPSMIGKMIEEDDEAFFIEYPFSLYREGGIIIASPYMPLAEDGIVAFKKSIVASTAVAPEYVTKHYLRLVDELREIKFTFKKEIESPSKISLPFEIKSSKIIH